MQHVAAHRPGRPGKIALDPELRAFVEARLARMAFAGIEIEVAAHFPPDRPQRNSSLVAANAAGRNVSQHNRPPAPRPTAQVAPFVQVLGRGGAIRLILAFGGAELSIGENPRDTNEPVADVRAQIRRGAGKPRHIAPPHSPAKPWRAANCHPQDLPIAQIARKLRVSGVAVRTYLRREAENRERLRTDAERRARKRT
ncbi:hypothetical protein PE067_04425 [Paracoccus sp. DMF-8]|uniref:hypothetical protein n=1 Tax=Paracoccus sp. DMF-8 TaxID=3019445 RepID=UPI0023E8E1CB|nr:hypothetical protein [Paracoccus sp. DMF-8]MDF3605462.1 hypothetical protein [Paracoccus sp. DMF-8]